MKVDFVGKDFVEYTWLNINLKRIFLNKQSATDVCILLDEKQIQYSRPMNIKSWPTLLLDFGNESSFTPRPIACKQNNNGFIWFVWRCTEAFNSIFDDL